MPGGSTPPRWIAFLPGVYGAGRNWTTVARAAMARSPDWGGLLVDLRQHGRSQGFSPPHDMRSTAGDLRRTIEAERKAVSAVLGHSFGGKVALVYAVEPDVPLEQVWVVDSTPDARPPGGSAWEMLGVLRRVRGPFRRRADAVEALAKDGLSPPLAQWMATNLQSDEESLYRWRISPDDMEALLVSFFRTDAWEVVEAPRPGSSFHFVKAEESSVLTEQACRRIEAAGAASGRVHLHRVRGGHWLNADNPSALVELLASHL